VSLLRTMSLFRPVTVAVCASKPVGCTAVSGCSHLHVAAQGMQAHGVQAIRMQKNGGHTWTRCSHSQMPEPVHILVIPGTIILLHDHCFSRYVCQLHATHCKVSRLSTAVSLATDSCVLLWPPCRTSCLPPGQRSSKMSTATAHQQHSTC
jgi:hypothetical protein